MTMTIKDIKTAIKKIENKDKEQRFMYRNKVYTLTELKKEIELEGMQMQEWQRQFLIEAGVPTTEENLEAFKESTSYKLAELKHAFVLLWETFKSETRELIIKIMKGF